MIRFNISLDGGVDMVLYALENAWGGEIFVPKIPSYRIMDVAKAIAPEIEHRVIGIRPGEKIHEEMITPSDSFNTYDMGKYYAILPIAPFWKMDDFLTFFGAKKVPTGFHYSSGENKEWLNVEVLRELIIEYVDASFSIHSFS